MMYDPSESKTTTWPACTIRITDANGFVTGAAWTLILLKLPSRVSIGIIISPMLGMGSPVADAKLCPVLLASVFFNLINQCVKKFSYITF